MALIPFNRRNPKFPSSPFNMIDNFFSDVPSMTKNFISEPFKVDVKEMENEYSVEAELPGINKEDVDLNLDDEGRLNIAVNRTESKDAKDEDDNYIHRERHFQSMQRTLFLDKADPDNVRANMKNGVLTVTVGKQEQSKENTRKIDIE